MTVERFANTPNQGITTLDGALSDSATTIPVSSMADLKLTGLTGTDFAYCKITKQENWRQHPINRKESFEIVKVTAVSGNDLIAIREVDGTSGTTFASGDIVEVVFVSIHYQDLVDAITDGTKELSIGPLTVSGDLNVSAAGSILMERSVADGIHGSIGGSKRSGITFGTSNQLYFFTGGNVLVGIWDDNGNFGIGGSFPTLPFEINAKIGFTSIGGCAIKLTNKSGGTLLKGQLVIASTSTANACDLAGASDDRVIGIVLDGGIPFPDGSELWIVVAGFAEVLMDAGGASFGNRIVSSTTAGSGLVDNGPIPAVHFQEIGHSVGSGGSGALVKCAIHLN